MTDLPPPILPIHIEETVRSIAKLQAEHHERTTPQQRAVQRLTDVLGRPAFLGIIALAVIGWIAGNLLASALGGHPIDPPPFPWLASAVAVVELFMVVLILGTQRHDDRLARRRELLALELAILAEQKTAKVIQLLEEARRDDPLIRDRVDPEAEVMAKPADPEAVLEAIKEKHAAVDERAGASKGASQNG